MKNLIIFLLILFLLSCHKNDKTVIIDRSENLSADLITHPDHIIFVWFENHGYNSIIGNLTAPFINSLISRGTLFTNSFAIGHPSYPNYVDFFAGNPNGIANDNCVNISSLTTPNLYTKLNKAGKTFSWYSEDLPATGSTICSYGQYREKHNPVTIFANVPASQNKRFADFPTDFTQLENVVCITPNMVNDMHDGTIAQGDLWLQSNLSALIDWCTTHNSIFVVYFDESESSGDNRLPLIAVGEKVKAGFQLATSYDHYNWTRTICNMFYAHKNWTTNLSSRTSITGCWLP